MVSSGDLYEFGEFVLRPRDYVLTRQGKPVSLTPKMFDVLVVLVRNHGRILGKDDIMKAVWADTVVEEGNLPVIIGHLRKALVDDAHHPTYIETVSRRGYRFIADVRVEAGNGTRPSVIGGPIAGANGELSSSARSAPPSDQNKSAVALTDWQPSPRSE